MTREELLALLDRFERSSLGRLEYAEGDQRLMLEKAAPAAVSASVPAPAPAAQARPAAPAAEKTEGDVIRSPLVGTFYAAASPEAEPFVRAGQAVKKDAAVCIIEAMKMMSEVPAPWDCVIEEVLVSNGDLIGFDQPLFRVRRQ